MLHRIIYLSTAINDFNPFEIKKMLFKAKINNKENNLTGILVYLEGNIIQIIEGEKPDVFKLYNRIVTDNRHKNIIKVIDGEITERQFEAWAMGFSEINTADFTNLFEQNDFDFQKILSKADFVANTFLTTFLKSHRRYIK